MKNVIITGGSRGIGRKLIDEFLNNGHRVFTVSRNIEGLKTIDNKHFSVQQCDFNQPQSIDEAFSKLDWEYVDILINNAGLLIKKPFEELSYDDFVKSFQVNYYAPARIIQLLEDKFSETAHIVNITTMGAVQGSMKFPELSIYGGTKASLIHLTELLAEEWKEKFLSINCLALGAVQTEMLEEAFPNYEAPLSAKQMAEYIYHFALEQGQYFHGKILQVSTSTP